MVKLLKNLDKVKKGYSGIMSQTWKEEFGPYWKDPAAGIISKVVAEYFADFVNLDEATSANIYLSWDTRERLHLKQGLCFWLNKKGFCFLTKKIISVGILSIM